MLVNPASPSLAIATSTFNPITEGTMDPPGDTKIVTVLPNLAFEPAGGSCLTTVLGGAFVLVEVCWLTWNPAARSVAVACVTDSCLTGGTVTCFGPLDTTRTTWLPAGTTFPFGGLVLITMFLGVVALGCFCTVYFSPAAVISCSAWVSVCPFTCGTACPELPPPRMA